MHATAKTLLLDYLVNVLTNRHQTTYDTMPHIPEQIPKVSSRTVHPYARTSWRQKRQTDGQAHRHIDGLAKTIFLDVSINVNPKSGLISNSIFCTMTILPWDMEFKNYYLGFYGGVNFFDFVSPRCSFWSISLKILEVWERLTIFFFKTRKKICLKTFLYIFYEQYLMFIFC